MSGNAPGEGSTPSYTRSALYSAIYGASSTAEAGPGSSSSDPKAPTTTATTSTPDGTTGASSAPAWSAALRFAPRARAGQSSSGAAGPSASAAAISRSRSIPSSLAIQPAASTSTLASSTSASAISSIAPAAATAQNPPTSMRSSTSAPKIATAFQSSSHNPLQDAEEDGSQEDEDGFDKWSSSNNKRGPSGAAGVGPVIKMPRTNARAHAAKPRGTPGSAGLPLSAAMPPPISSVHGRPSLQRPSEPTLAASSSSASAAAAYSTKKATNEQTQKQQDLKRPRLMPSFGPPPITLTEEELANDKELARAAADRRGESAGGPGRNQEEEEEEEMEPASSSKKKWKKKRNKNEAPALNMDAEYDPRLPNDYIAFRALLRERRQAEADLSRERRAAAWKGADKDAWHSDEEDEGDDYRHNSGLGRGYDEVRRYDERADEEHRKRMMKFAPPPSYGASLKERRPDDSYGNENGRHGWQSSNTGPSGSRPMTYGERAEMEARIAERDSSGGVQHRREESGAEHLRDRGSGRDSYEHDPRENFTGWGHEVSSAGFAPAHAPQGFAPTSGPAPTSKHHANDNLHSHDSDYGTDIVDAAAIPGFVTSGVGQYQKEQTSRADASSAPSSSGQVDVAEAIRRAKQIAQSLTAASQNALPAMPIATTTHDATDPSAANFIHPSRLAQMEAQGHQDSQSGAQTDPFTTQNERPDGQQQEQQHAWSADKSGVVARLMAQMGHKEGEGIGADGNRGRVAPLSVKVSSSSSTSRQHHKNADWDGNSRPSGPGAGSYGKRGTIVGGSAATEGTNSSLERERYGASSEVVLLENMVDASGMDDDLGDEIREECSKFGRVARVFIYPVPASSDVRIFVAFEGPAGAWQAVRELDGRFFGGRTVRARYYPRETFQMGSYLE